MLDINELKDRVKKFNKDFAIERIIEAIRQYFKKTGMEKAFIGLSGGIDSSVTFVLLTEALGNNKVEAILMPHKEMTPRNDMEDAYNLARKYGVEPIKVEISEITDTIKASIQKDDKLIDKVTYGNIIARSRMIILYALANQMNGLVVGSSDKSELLLGYFTKYGDGGADILPIGDLYKTQVRVLGAYLGLPENIVEKPSSPRLWPNHKAEDELGASYEVIDAILYALIELRRSFDDVLKIKGVDRDVVENILRRVFASEHKRRVPFIPKLSPGMTIGIDWRIPRISKFI